MLQSTSSKSLHMCEYRKRGVDAPWTSDIFALVHNGIRHEIEDLAVFLLAIQNIGGDLVTTDFSDLRGWWDTFADIVDDYMDLEEKVLQPWFSKALERNETPDSVSAAFISFRNC
jgi:hypothetical protein